MKYLIIPLLLVFSASADLAQYAGNDSDDGPVSPRGIFAPYTGNAAFATNDLVVAGSVRNGLFWRRYANSRTPETEPLFGLGHNWTDNWQWEMVDEGQDSQGRPIVLVRAPKGTVHLFTETSPGQWWPAPSVKDRVVSDGDSFRVLQPAEGEVRFTRSLTPQGEVFTLNEIVDPDGNVWTLSWANGHLAQVTAPAGRWLKISYAVLSPPGAAAGQPSFTVVSQVAASDGQTVAYAYAFPAGVDYPVLTKVTYPDGSIASYTYATPRPGDRLLLTQADDPRAVGAVRGRTFQYQTAAGAALGQIAQITARGDGAVFQSLAADASGARSYAWTQPDGSTVYRTFNPGGNLAGEIDALGYAKKYDYDANGRGFATAATDQLGQVTRFENDTDGNVIKQTAPDGTSRAWQRDDRGRVLSYTDELGHARTYTRDALGRIIQTQYPDGTSEKTTYDAFGQPLTRTARDGGVSIFSRDARGLLASTTNALGAIRTHAYDARDRLAAVTDPLGHTTSYERDAAGRPTKVTYADGSASTMTYDNYGQITQTVDPTGMTQTIAYDAFGRRISTTDGLGHETREDYAALGAGGSFNRPSQLVSPSGRITAMDYDPNGRLLARTIAAGTSDAVTTRSAYDADGRVISVTDARGQTTQKFYDARGCLIKVMNALNYATTYTYDAAGYRLSKTDPKGNTTQWTYDAMGNQLTQTDANGQTIRRTYDAAGRLIALTDPKGNTYRFEYDAVGHQTALAYPDGSRETTTYDPAGNQLTYTNRAGAVRSFAYDNRNREISSDWSDGSQHINKAYDADGRMTLEDNGVSRLTFAYNLLGQLTSETQDLSAVVTGGTVKPAPRTIAYAYDADGRRATLTYPDGTVITYTYNARGLLQDIIGNGAQPPIASYDYDNAGNATLMPREDSTQTAQTYDAANRLTYIVETDPQHEPTDELDYTYDEADNRTSTTQTLNPGTTLAQSTRDAYGYDNTYQVTGVDYGTPVTVAGVPTGAPAHSVCYTYDAVGNRLTVNKDESITRYTANNLNQYVQVGRFAPSYDRNGNLASMGDWLYQYDAMNRLILATDGKMTARFYYDAQNRCVARNYNGAAAFNYYDTWNLLEENSPSGAELARYVRGRRVDELVLIANQYGTFYPHSDVLGNVTFLTDVTGKIVERYDYTITGKVTFRDASWRIVPASLTGNRFFFAGREWLSPINDYDFRNRVYTPLLGRFLQTDPLRFRAADINIYRFVENNFNNLIDPSGLDVVALQAPSDAAGFGHTAMIVGNDIDGYSYFTYGGDASSSSASSGNNLTEQDGFVTLQDAMDYANQGRSSSEQYTQAALYYTTPDQDQSAVSQAQTWSDTDYSLLSHNCVDMVNDAMNSAGIPTTPDSIPNDWYYDNSPNSDENGPYSQFDSE